MDNQQETKQLLIGNWRGLDRSLIKQLFIGVGSSETTRGTENKIFLFYL